MTNGEVYNASGQAVAPFPRTYTGTSILTPAIFPILDPAPNVSGATSRSSTVNGVYPYPNGMGVASDKVEVSSDVGTGYSWQRTDIDYAMHNAHGSWGDPIRLAQSATNRGADLGGSPDVGVEYSKSGNFLINTTEFPSAKVWFNDLAVYKINTHTYTDLATLPAITAGGYSNLLAGQIDDQGRIVFLAYHSRTPGGPESTVAVLLTPTGLSPDSLMTVSPEPGSWAVMALAMAALAVRRIEARRSRSEA